jgi:glycolate dehydrogenase FAD-binding subunit
VNQKIDILKEQVLTAINEANPLKIIGGNSKAFLGRQIEGTTIDMSDYSGVVSYEPTELYISVKAGTLLSDVKKVLSEQNQMLAFEPPQINEKTTIGGIVATGLSGPRRPYSGSVRDFVLGIKCINGLAKDLSFGGQVMKNVAGYDLSRLLTGSYGTLGIIHEVTFKVLPLPEFELTGSIAIDRLAALKLMSELSTKPNPVSAVSYDGENLFVRFSGNEKTVNDSLKEFNLEKTKRGEEYWDNLCHYKHSVFNQDKPIWRLSVPQIAQIDLKDEECLIDWAGSQYWLASNRSADEIFSMAAEQGGSAMLFRGGDQEGAVFQPLSKTMFKFQQQVKQAFDPHYVLNPGKLYKEL